MEKSIYSGDYTILLKCLRKAREDANLTQEELGLRLGQTQSFVSKCERGERRLDVLELIAFSEAIGLDFALFLQRLQKAFSRTGR